MKAIILAAGTGTRLRPLTDDKPKCMVNLNDKPMLDWQIGVLTSEGIDEIHVVAGYRKEKIVNPKVILHENKRYATTNMVTTLFCAEAAMDGNEDIIISYGDIVYSRTVLKSLKECVAPVCVVVDKGWFGYWKERMDDPMSDAETLKMEGDARIVELGKKPKGLDEVQGQYIGLFKIRADMVKAFRDVWREMDRQGIYDGQSFDNMYMTSFLQHLIDTDWTLRPVFTDRGWFEVDSPSDLALAQKGFTG